jgi:hypothetical protein
MANKDLKTNVGECIETMKKKNINVNFKCTQYEALAVTLGVAAAAAAVHIIVTARKTAKLKKKLTAKIEKAYAKKYADLENALKAEYEAKLAAIAEEPADEAVEA